MTSADVGLFHYLVKDGAATIGTINSTRVYLQPADDIYRKNAFIDKVNTNMLLIIPEMINYKNQIYIVTIIGYMAFAYANITYAFVPKSINTIFGYAFDWCINLKKN